MNGIKEGKCFYTTDEQSHTSRLIALNHQYKIDLRGIVQNDEKYGKRNGGLTTTEIADLIARNGEVIAKTNTYYRTAINRERSKPAPMPKIAQMVS